MDQFHISPDSFNPEMLGYESDTTSSTTTSATAAPQPAAPAPESQPAPQPQPTAAPPKAEAPKAAPKPRPAAKAADDDDEGGFSLMAFLTDRRTKIFAGIVLAVATVYLFIVTFSFFATTIRDQALVESNSLPELVDKSKEVGNSGGPLGAWISNTLINKWLGLGSLILVVWMGLVGLSLLGVKKIRFGALTFRCLLSAIALSGVVGFITYKMSSPIFWGGLHGHYLTQSIENVAGVWGALGVCLILVAMVTLLFLKDLQTGYYKLRTAAAARSMVMAERRAARRAEKERRRAAKAADPERLDDDPEPQPTAAPKPKAAPEPKAAAESAPTPSKSASRREEPAAQEPAEEEVSIDGPVTFADPSPIPTIGNMEIVAPVIEQAEPQSSPEDEPESETDEQQEQSAPAAAPGTGDRYDPREDLYNYHFPTLDLLKEYEQKGVNVDTEEQEKNKQQITKTLNDYGIPISSIKATVGPTVTLYEIIPAEGVRIAKIKRLEDDIALQLAALGIRIIAPIPGKGTIGIEVPNKDPQTVSIRSILGSKAFAESRMDLPMALGCTIQNDVFIADLTKMPHLLVAGATGMGKSVGLNTIIASLLYKKHPAELKFVLVDPKMVEFSLYSKLERHYLAKLPDEEEAIITNPAKVVATLNSLCVEMDSRYGLLKTAGCRTIKEYNEKFTRRVLSTDKGHRFLPYIVVVVDEFADLLVTAGKEVETPIARIAQKARAVGIHMILATQRPSTNVITGTIKANFPGRIAFRVFQMVDSRTILDRPGANQLIGRGDMLFSNSGKIERVQCAFIDTPEVQALCDFIDNQVGYPTAYLLPEYTPEDDGSGSIGSLNDRDSLFEEAARYVVQSNTASTSNLQRRYSIGYNRAGKIMDQLEAAGIVGPSMGSKPRSVLVDSIQLERMLDASNI